MQQTAVAGPIKTAVLVWNLWDPFEPYSLVELHIADDGVNEENHNWGSARRTTAAFGHRTILHFGRHSSSRRRVSTVLRGGGLWILNQKVPMTVLNGCKDTQCDSGSLKKV